jgi:hypothetical protein
MRTLAGLSSRVAAVGAGRLLDVEGPLACQVARESVSKVVLNHCIASTRCLPSAVPTRMTPSRETCKLRTERVDRKESQEYGEY